MSVTTSPNMKLPVPDLTEPGPQYASDVNESLDIIDAHDHDGINGGVLIDLAEQDVNSDLSVHSHNISNVRSVELNDNLSLLTGSQDVNCLYVLADNLGFNNSNGVFIPITSGSTLAITALSLTNFASRDITSNATILPTDTYNLINVDSTAGAITVTLPIAAVITPVAANRLYIIRDVGEQAGSNNITVAVSGGSGNLFADSGATSFILNTAGGYVGVYTDGISSWYTFTQNTYNTETMVFNTSSQLTLNSGSQLNVNASAIEVNTGSAVNLSGGAALTVGGGSTADFNISTINFNNPSTTTFKVGSQIAINGKLSGTTSSGNLNIAGTGSITAATPGGITASVANGINDGGVFGAVRATVQGGINSHAAGGIQSIVDGGIQNGGSSGDWVSFSASRSESRVWPLICNGNPTVFDTGNVLNNDDTYFTNKATSSPPNSFQRWLLPQMHNGATLDSVNVKFFVTQDPALGTGIATIDWPNMFQIKVYRVDTDAGAQGTPSPSANSQPLSATDPQTPTTTPQCHVIPISNVDWFQGGNIQDITYTCDTRNVIDNSRYQYYVGVKDLTSNTTTGSSVVEAYMVVKCNYTMINDMRFI